MSDIQKITHIDLESTTIIGTAIEVLFATIVAILIVLLGGLVFGVNGALTMLPLASTLIFATIICNIYTIFTGTYLYNVLTSKLNPISIKIEDDTLKYISVMPTAIIMGLITTILVVMIYLASIFLLPLILSFAVQTLMFSGQMAVAYALYELLTLYSNPLIVILVIMMAFISVVLFSAVFCGLYNLISPKITQVNLKLGSSGDMTTIESINPLNLAIIYTAIVLIIQLIIGIFNAVTSGDIMSLMMNTVIGVISTFILTYITCVFYNLLTKILSPIKIKLAE